MKDTKLAHKKRVGNRMKRQGHPNFSTTGGGEMGIEKGFEVEPGPVVTRTLFTGVEWSKTRRTLVGGLHNVVHGS